MDWVTANKIFIKDGLTIKHKSVCTQILLQDVLIMQIFLMSILKLQLSISSILHEVWQTTLKFLNQCLNTIL